MSQGEFPIAKHFQRSLSGEILESTVATYNIVWKGVTLTNDDENDNMSKGNHDVNAQKYSDTSGRNLRGLDRVAGVRETSARVGVTGNPATITVVNATDTSFNQRVKAAATSTGLDPRQETQSKGSVGRKEVKHKAVGGSNPDRPGSPKLSLPPEDPLVAQASSKEDPVNDEVQKLTKALSELSTENDVTSLSTNVREFLPKILKVDIENKRLKETNAHLEEELARYKSLWERSRETHRKVVTDRSQAKKEHDHEDGESGKRQEEFVKMKKQLKKAIEANQAWSNYSNDQLKIHLRQLQANDETVRKLQEKLKSEEKHYQNTILELKSQRKDAEARLSELEEYSKALNVKNQQLEEEQRKVRKFALGLMKEKNDLTREVEELTKKVEQMSPSYEKNDGATSAEKSNGTTSDTSMNLSHPLRNVESAMDKECLTKAINVDSGVSTPASSPPASNDGSKRTSDEANDAISILQEQVRQFREDFYREREDRERAFGELDKLRKELEDTRILLHEQTETVTKKKSKLALPKFHIKHKPEKEKRENANQGAAFRYLDPDEVTELQRNDTGRNERRVNTYEGDQREGKNHVYHEIDEP